MAFRRRRFSGRRRSQTRWETSTVIQCYNNSLTLNGPTCALPSIDVIPLLTMTSPFQAAPERYPAPLGTKALIFGGMKFQSEHKLDPTTDFSGDDPPNTAAIIHLWEAIVVLPLAQGSTFTPAYLPTITSPVQQGIDLADRVLWKRISHMPWWGGPITGNVPQLQSTIRDSAHQQEVVKTKCRIDDRHGLFYVRNAFWNVILSPLEFVNPIWDLYAKMFWRVSLR